MEKSILLVCATKPEWGMIKDFGFQRVVGHEGPVFYQATHAPTRHRLFLCQTGIGWERAERSVKNLFSKLSFDLVIHFGLSGALIPELGIADLISPTECVAENGEIPVGKFEKLSLPFPVHRGVFLTARKVLCIPDQKLSCGKKYGAVAVDMETYLIASYCAAHAVPYISIRAIFDPLNWDLTRMDEANLMSEEGEVRLGNIAGQAIRNPRLLMELPKYRTASLKACAALKDCLTIMLEGV